MATREWKQAHHEEMLAYQREYQKEWYREHAERVRPKIYQRREEISEWFASYKAELACIECGENHPACLEFHHRNPAEKDIDLGKAVKQGWSIQRILAEMEKCDVLCSNCHRKRHYQEKMPS